MIARNTEATSESINICEAALSCVCKIIKHKEDVYSHSVSFVCGPAVGVLLVFREVHVWPKMLMNVARRMTTHSTGICTRPIRIV